MCFCSDKDEAGRQLAPAEIAAATAIQAPGNAAELGQKGAAPLDSAADASHPRLPRATPFGRLHPKACRVDTAIMARLRREWLRQVKDARVTVFGAPPIPGLSVRYWQVTIQAEGNFRRRTEDLHLIEMRNKQGQMVSLGTLVDVRLVIAQGAGAEMRRSLGTAVFSGMLGVTLFGIFLTPVFFSIIAWLGETRLLANRKIRWLGTALAGGLLGGAIGFLLAKIGIGHLPRAPLCGFALGMALALLFPAIGRRMKASAARLRPPGN
jgi:hypothetical protein